MWKKFVGLLEYSPLWLFVQIMGFVRYDSRIKIGSIIIAFAIRLIPKYRKRVFANLKLVFPELSREEQKNFLKKFSQNLGTTFTEFLFNNDFQKNQQIHLKDVRQLDEINNAVKNAQPVIIVSGHFGPWEAVRATLKKSGLEAGAVYRPSKNIFYEPHHHRTISAGGTPIFQTGRKGTGKMVRHLKSGGIICLMIDQSVSDGRYLDFLGKPAKTSLAVANLAIRYNALLIPAYATRNKNQVSIQVELEPHIPITTSEEMTKKILDSLAVRILANPTQWYWVHNRWK